MTTRGADSKSDLASPTKQGGQLKTRFSVRELGSATWPDFERMVQKHNGVWGGCWCTFFHLTPSLAKQWSGKHKEYKEKLVRANRSHAALVYDGADVVGWCQFGPPPELPGRRSEEHTSELQSRLHLVCRLLLEKKKKSTRHLVSRHTTVRWAIASTRNVWRVHAPPAGGACGRERIPWQWHPNAQGKRQRRSRT